VGAAYSAQTADASASGLQPVSPRVVPDIPLSAPNGGLSLPAKELLQPSAAPLVSADVVFTRT
jgi:hypothetical protein